MALTLLEASKLRSDPVESSIIEMYPRTSSVMTYLPFENIQGNALKYNREETLPGVGFRGVNENWTESTGVLNPQVETLVIAGGEIKVDNFIVKTEGEGARTTQENMKIKANTGFFTRKFFKGDSASDPREFDGLQVRLIGEQLIEAGSTDGGDALSLLKLDELIDAVEDPDALWMNQTIIRLINQAARDSTIGGYVTYSRDEFGKRVVEYNGIPIYPVKRDNLNTEILPFTEVGSGGATATATSIYCTSKAEGHLTGIQSGEMDIADIGKMESEPKHLTRIEWYPGIALRHGKSAARLRGIKNAAVVK